MFKLFTSLCENPNPKIFIGNTQSGQAGIIKIYNYPLSRLIIPNAIANSYNANAKVDRILGRQKMFSPSFLVCLDFYLGWEAGLCPVSFVVFSEEFLPFVAGQDDFYFFRKFTAMFAASSSCPLKP